jgi:hypothetical protein
MLTSAVLFYGIALSGLFNLGAFTMHYEYFYLAEVLHTDFLRAFWLAVLVSSLAVSFIIAVLVGWAMRLWQRRHGISAARLVSALSSSAPNVIEMLKRGPVIEGWPGQGDSCEEDESS